MRFQIALTSEHVAGVPFSELWD